MEAASLMGEPAASPLLSSPTTPTTTRARKQPRQALSEADIPALPPADASQEEKARIMKERRRVQERIREQQRDRSARKRPSAAEDSARRAEDRAQEMALSMLTDARRLPLPRVDCVCDRTFNNLVNLTNTWLDAAEAENRWGYSYHLERNDFELEQAWQAILPGQELPKGKIGGKGDTMVTYGISYDLEDRDDLVTGVSMGDGINMHMIVLVKVHEDDLRDSHTEFGLRVGYLEQGDARQYTNLHESPRQYPFVDGIEYLFAKLDCECKECCDDRDHHPCFAPTLLARDDPCAPYRVHAHLDGIARIRVQSAAFDDHWWRGRVEGMELQDQPDAIAVFTQSRDSWLVRNETKWSV